MVAVIVFAFLGCQRDEAGGQETAAGTAPQQNVQAAATASVVRGRFEAATWLDGGLRVAATEIDGTAVVAVATAEVLRLYSGQGRLLAERKVSGTVQLLEFVRAKHTVELWFGTGMSARSRDARLELTVFDAATLKVRESLGNLESSRQQWVDLAVTADGAIWVAYFVDKYGVEISQVSRGPLAVDGTRRVRMLSAMDFALPNSQLLYTRVYGDAIGEDGGVFAIDGDGSVRRLPSTRGARAAVWDAQAARYIVADGWHREYAAKAEGLVTAITVEPGAEASRILGKAEVYGYRRVLARDIDGDGISEIVAVGNGPAVAFRTSHSQPESPIPLGGGQAVDAAVADLDGDGDVEVVLVGSEPGIWRP